MDSDQPPIESNPKPTKAFLISACFFMFVIAGGALWGGKASTCFEFIGCNAGFFGYDGVEHFFFGILEAIFIIWLAKHSPKFNFCHENFFKNVVIIFSIVLLVGFSWEVLEFAHDRILDRAVTFNAVGLLRPSMAQASNSDTMGDLTLDLIGGMIGIAILKVRDRDCI